MIVIFLVIGLAAGVLSGVFGIGGGIIIVPALLYFAKLTPAQSVGTSLGALLLPVGAAGAWAYWKAGELNVKGSLLIALGLFVGAFFGAKLGQMLSPQVLKKAFAVLLVAVAAKMFTS